MRIRTPDVRRLPCSDHLKEIVYRCLGERRKRYESADELIDALRNPPAALQLGVLRTLKGVHLTFTGILSQPRRDADARRPARRRARPQRTVGRRPRSSSADGRTRCRPRAATPGLKLMEIKRLREKGHKITVLNDTQFWRLAAKR